MHITVNLHCLLCFKRNISIQKNSDIKNSVRPRNIFLIIIVLYIHMNVCTELKLRIVEFI